MVNLPQGPKRVYVVTGVIMGDNKGLMEIDGYVESVRANFPCRICKAPFDSIQIMLEEVAALMRTPLNYEEDVLANNMTKTGIKEKCIFTALPAFEMPTDVSVDIFHDLHEGVAHYTMLSVLRHFHKVDRTFIETLNLRMYMFDYGIDSDNKPVSISVDRLTCDKLKLTGAEMFVFVKLFGVFMGDRVDEGDDFWQLYLLLRDIMTLCCCKDLPKDARHVLAVKVKDHNALYRELTKDTLKQKHHNLCHYSTLMKRIGLLADFSTIRCEGKHKVLKATANVCSSRVNLALTIAIKQQLALCYRITCNQSILASKLLIGTGSFISLEDLSVYPVLKNILPKEIVRESEYVFVPKWVEYKGSVYKPKMVLLTGFNPELGDPIFSEIDFLLVHKDQPLFVCSLLDTLGWYTHVRGFKVEKSENERPYCVVADALYDPLPLGIYEMRSGEKIVVTRYFYY